jgi:hypothetical protein
VDPEFGGIDWDLAPDSKRVVVLTPVESTGTPPRDFTRWCSC